MGDDGFPSASSARARRTRSSAGAAPPVQRSLGSGIDDFLGGGRAPAAPAPEPTKMPEAGGWVSDKSGTENYEDPIGKGGSFKVDMGEFRAAAQRAADGAPFEMPPGSVQKQQAKVPRQRVPEMNQEQIEAATARTKSEPKQERGRFPKVDAVANGTSTETLVGDDARELRRRIDAEVAKAQIGTMPIVGLDESLAAPRKAGTPNSPEMHPAYARIIRTTFAFEPDKVFDELTGALHLPKPMRDMGYLELAETLDQAARHYVNASRLYAHAKVTLAQFEADCETMGGDMRMQAVNQLKAEKEKQGGKQITEGDVTARMALLFPDEYRRQARMKAEGKAFVGHAEDLVKNWELRRRELDTMLRECRKA